MKASNKGFTNDFISQRILKLLKEAWTQAGQIYAAGSGSCCAALVISRL
jgi:hypothetical protein